MGLITISYRAAVVGAGAYTALDDSSLFPVYPDFKLPMSRSPQVEALYGSANVFVRGTGNAAWKCSFQSITTHASEAAAVLYLESQPAAIPETVDLKFVLGATTLYLPAAVFNLFDPEEPGGVTNRIRYGFIAGNLTATAP